MTYKKNWIGVCLWAFYALAVFIGYAKALYDVLQAPHVTNHYIQFGIVFLSFALVTAVFIQIRKLANLLKRPVHVLWEALLFVLLFATGVFLRIYFIGRGTEHAAYFETAMVNGSPVTTLAHGAQYFYVLLLRGLFLLTGNHFMAGIILQICLQMLAAIVWYLAIKRLSGRTAALVLFGGLMLIPASIWEGLLYSPKMLYMLLCGIVLLMIGRMCRRQVRKEPFKWHAWLQTTLTGVGIGVLAYLDVTGVLFLIPVLFLPFLNGEVSKEDTPSGGKRLGRAMLQLLLVVLLAFGTFVLLLSMDAMQNGAGIQEVFTTWGILFSYKEISAVPGILKAGTLLEAWILVAVAFFMLIGVLAFFIRRKEEVQMPWLFFAVAAAALYAGGFCAESMDCEYMLLTAALLLAGTGLQAAFCKTADAEGQEDGTELPDGETGTEEKPSEAEGKERPEEQTLLEALAKEQPQEQPLLEALAKEQPQEQLLLEALAKEQPLLEALVKEQPEEQKASEAVTQEQSREEKAAAGTEAAEPETAYVQYGVNVLWGPENVQSRQDTEGQKEAVQQSIAEQNQTEGGASQMSYNSEYGEGMNQGEQDSLWALFAGDDGAAKSNSETGKSAGKKAEAKKAKEKEKKEKEKKEKEKKAKEKPAKAAKEEKAAAVAAAPPVQEKAEEKKKNYIENPLPLPKKHVPKTMNYRTELSPDKMDFDIDIPEFDDFDI